MSDQTIALDRRVVAASKPVQVLAALSWPETSVDTFLGGWRRGDPRLPEVVAPALPDIDDALAQLAAVEAEADRADPLQRFVADTAASYALAAQMLKAAGTPSFTERSIELYGSPAGRMTGTDRTHLAAAEHLLEATAPFAGAADVEEGAYCLSASVVRNELTRAFATLFGQDAPTVVIDANLASKAAAGATRVRLRDGTCFSELDVLQLIEHEGFVHSATALNGRAQPILSCMGLSTPRTTATQEGLATLAELVTRSIDVARLRRLALRTVAIQHALSGADYIDIFRFFLEQGQTEDESAHSAMRVFRGSDGRGSVAFTKDVVYLQGLFAVHAFMRRAVAEGKAKLTRQLFAGRFALGDLSGLQPAFADGSLIDARFVPPWASDLPRLAAWLAVSGVAGWIDVDNVTL